MCRALLLPWLLTSVASTPPTVGEWTGDTLAVTLPNLACTFDDLQTMRLALVQTLSAADRNGVMSGNCPNNTYITDYALLWFEGAMQYL